MRVWARSCIDSSIFVNPLERNESGPIKTAGQSTGSRSRTGSITHSLGCRKGHRSEAPAHAGIAGTETAVS
jgi:hypothetical protein